jgi:hypothetical protein
LLVKVGRRLTVNTSRSFASGVNSAGEVAFSSLAARQSAYLWRNGVNLTLKAPKGATDASCHGLARTASSPTFAVGGGQFNFHSRAVIWEFK